MLRKLENRIFGKYRLLKQKIISINWENNWETEMELLNQLVLKRNTYSKLDKSYDSLFQFKAQTSNLSVSERVLYGVISFFVFHYLLIRYSLVRINKQHMNCYDVAFFFDSSIFSQNKKVGKEMVFVERTSGSLEFGDIVYVYKLLVKFSFNFSLLSVCLFRVAQASFCIRKYGVNELWTSMEYSCGSGVLTDYCNRKNVKVINYMHGEKILTLRDCFCAFDTFFVWNEHYRNLFENMYSNSDLVLANPWEDQELFFKYEDNRVNKKICYFFKGFENDSEISILLNVFNKLKNLGYTIVLKDHPRQQKISGHFIDYEVIPKDVDFLTIVEDYGFIMAQYSTVLNQGFIFKKNVIIDDLSNGLLVEQLKDRNYFFFTVMNERVFKLSDFFNNED